MANLGYIGLGEMGGRMAARLIAAGHTVTGYNRTRSKAEWLIEKGMRWADTPRQVTESSDIVFSMVTNTKAVEAITQGADGIIAALGPDKLYIDMSTMSPEYSKELAQQVAETGAKMLDAPVSGSVITLVEGKLSIMVGGDKDAFEQAKPILLDIGPRATHVGGNGLAVAMKIATNLSLAAQMLAFSEGVLLAEQSGIDREVAVDVLVNSVIASPMVKYRGPFVLETPQVAWFNADMMQKDLNLAVELGQKLNVPTPSSSLCNEYLTTANGMGLGEHDFATMFNVLAKMAGLADSDPKVADKPDDF